MTPAAMKALENHAWPGNIRELRNVIHRALLLRKGPNIEPSDLTFDSRSAVPDRIGAGASFHGGGLVTKTPDSPHLLVPQMKASFLFCVAENDDQRDPTAKDVLRETFAKQGLEAEIEVYAAQHGWCPPDMPVYDEVKAERAWSRLLVLFGSALAKKI